MNRFSSRADQSKRRYWIWELSKSKSPREISTANACVSNYFYGDSDTSIEDAFAAAESKFAGILGAIDGGESPNNYSDELRKFVWSQGVRTRALREYFKTSARDILAEFGKSAQIKEARTVVLKELEQRLDEVIANELSGLPPKQQLVARRVLSNSTIRQKLLDQARAQITPSNLDIIFRGAAEILLNHVDLGTAAAMGHVRGLARMLQPESISVPENFNPKNWHIMHDQNESVVLGDSCVFVVLGDGTCRSLLKDLDSWKEVYLPLSKKQVLVGQKELGQPTLDISSTNLASSKLALSYIYAPQLSAEIERLVPMIGTGVPLLAQDEIFDLIMDSWRQDSAAS